MTLKYYVAILYPENFSKLEKFKELICEHHQFIGDVVYSMLVSPVHSSDSECKEPHMHCILACVKRLSKNDVQLLRDIGFKMQPKPDANICVSKQSYERYLTHLDDPDKEQFPPDVQPIPIGDYHITQNDNLIQLIQLTDMFDELIDMIDYMRSFPERFTPEWFRILSGKTYFFQSLFMSKRKKIKKELDFGNEN